VAIQPIDLQTLYTQLEKIGKTQVQQQVAAQAEREAEIVKNRNEAEKQLKTVKETDAGSEIAGKVHEKNGKQDTGGAFETTAHNDPRKESEDKKETVEPTKEVITDPALGTHIDISG
jgi:hypothetical protein